MSGSAVLVVDDDEGMLITLREILELEGIDSVGARSGKDAIDRAMRQGFAAALLDINMPDLDGIDTLRELRKLQPGLPAILMTAYSLKHLGASAASVQVETILFKPLDIEQLLGLLRKLVKSAL